MKGLLGMTATSDSWQVDDGQRVGDEELFLRLICA